MFSSNGVSASGREIAFASLSSETEDRTVFPNLPFGNLAVNIFSFTGTTPPVLTGLLTLGTLFADSSASREFLLSVRMK